MLAISRFSAPLAVFIFNAGVAVAEPVPVAIAKAPVERLVARGCWKPLAYVRTVDIERRRRREGWKTRAGKFFAKWTICSPEPLAISRMTPVLGKTSRRISKIKSRLRIVAGAYRRSSLILPVEPMEQEFVAKRRKRAFGHTRALPRRPPPDGKRPLFPRDLSRPVGADRG